MNHRNLDKDEIVWFVMMELYFWNLREKLNFFFELFLKQTNLTNH